MSDSQDPNSVAIEKAYYSDRKRKKPLSEWLKSEARRKDADMVRGQAQEPDKPNDKR